MKGLAYTGPEIEHSLQYPLQGGGYAAGASRAESNSPEWGSEG